MEGYWFRRIQTALGNPILNLIEIYFLELNTMAADEYQQELIPSKQNTYTFVKPILPWVTPSAV